MSKVGDALKRKLGPLPVWLWAIIAGAGLYYYRNRTAAGTAAAAATTAATATTPQPVTTLQPGESAYDPNTGSLQTAPGGGGSGDTGGGGTTPPVTGGGDGGAAGVGGTDPTGAIEDLVNAIDGAITSGESNNPPTTTPATTKPTIVKSPTRTAKPKAATAAAVARRHATGGAVVHGNEVIRQAHVNGRSGVFHTYYNKAGAVVKRAFVSKRTSATVKSKSHATGRGAPVPKARSRHVTAVTHPAARSRPTAPGRPAVRSRPVAATRPAAHAPVRPAPHPAPKPAPRRQAAAPRKRR